MTATCHICDKEWDAEDPGVRKWWGTDEWECNDEEACLGRRSDALYGAEELA